MTREANEPMSGRLCVALLLPLLLPFSTLAANEVHNHESHRMTVTLSGMVMNNNRDTLPWDCDAISRDHEFVVEAGRSYAKQTPGMVFGMSQYDYHVAPCSRITVTFSNKDEVRHQWMVHGLPKYLYPTGMFHLEAMAGQSVQGTFIVPGDDKTYLVHCDMSQHMEKGMKGQLVVGEGSGDLWSVAGVSDSFRRASYLPAFSVPALAVLTFLVFTLTLIAIKKPWMTHNRRWRITR